jgi:hypothetical protein
MSSMLYTDTTSHVCMYLLSVGAMRPCCGVLHELRFMLGSCLHEQRATGAISSAMPSIRHDCSPAQVAVTISFALHIESYMLRCKQCSLFVRAAACRLTAGRQPTELPRPAVVKLWHHGCLNLFYCGTGPRVQLSLNVARPIERIYAPVDQGPRSSVTYVLCPPARHKHFL